MSMIIPFLDISRMHNVLKQQFISAFESEFDKGQFILGKSVQEFENNYSKFNNVEYALGVGNGLDALKIALKILNIGPGDEVIIPSNTFIATALAVSEIGADIVLCEPNRLTYNINVDLIESHISKRTKAIIPVHLYGQACEMAAIMAIASRYGLFVIEDNAQAQGAAYDGKLTGSIGHINATSFYPGKNLGAFGDAGAITTDHNEYYRLGKKYRNYGSDVKYIHELKGTNSRLDELQAAMLNVKLRHLNSWNVQRQKIAELYYDQLNGVGDVVLPELAKNCTHVYHLYVVRTKRRDELQKHLASKNIDTLIHYPIPIHLQQAYADLKIGKGAFPIAEKISSTALSLPIYPGLKVDEIEYISASISEFFK